MSDDQQKQPQSENTPSQIPPAPSAAEPTTRVKKPLFKALTIKILQGTIGLLEGIVQTLEAEPVQKIPPADTITATLGPELESSVSEEIISDSPTEIPASPVSDTPTEIPNPVVEETPSVTPAAIVSDSPTVVPEVVTEEPREQQLSPQTKPGLFDRLFPSFDKLQAFWDATLAKVRTVLPSPWNEKLSDWALTGVITGIVVIVLVTTALITPETPTQVAKAPVSTPTPPELKAPTPPQPIEPVVVEEPPVPELTPEQSLIAAIQQQVADITERYGNGVIQSVEANFLGSRLMVKMSDRWYELKESQQNNLADEILQRSRELDFSKLEISDLKGTLLARSPVVGSNMVILKRQELATTL